jgi:hypothetical protein
LKSDEDITIVGASCRRWRSFVLDAAAPSSPTKSKPMTPLRYLGRELLHYCALSKTGMETKNVIHPCRVLAQRLDTTSATVGTTAGTIFGTKMETL